MWLYEDNSGQREGGFMNLSRKELEVMEVLWNAGRDMSATDIVAAASVKSWKESSIYILLNSLLNKQAIEEKSYVRSGKTYASTFMPTQAGVEYYADALAESANKTSPKALFAALCQSEDITLDKIEELESLLQQRKKELLEKQ
jgi:BlaI family penicillinase repressor